MASARVVLSTFGARGLARRVRFTLRREAGRLRSLPSAVPAAVGVAPVAESWPFRPDAERVRAVSPRAAAMERAERVAAGEHQAYRHEWRPLPRTSHQWHTHPVSGVAYHRHAPWYHIRHFDAAVGDIKDMWEPARFAWAYDLARGWMLSRDERFPEAFWQSLERFLEGCPPFHGVQWSCGQETAIRALALLWAEGAFLDAAASTPERLATLRRALAWSAERICDAIDYALSQRNNHGISEAAGLVAVGARLLHADPRARRWLDRGARLLDAQIEDQVAEDGWYIQHSLNYARVALDMLVLSRRTLAAAGRTLSPAALRRASALTTMLARCADPASGEPPLHGANDGAYVLPLSTAPYRDFAPSLTAAAATFGVALPRCLRVDEETLAWLDAAPPRTGGDTPALVVGESGWALASAGSTRVFARAGGYRSRPGHIDALHLDVRIGGRGIATDAGSFRYAAPVPWNNGLAAEEVHNTVTIPGLPMARRGPRFLWLRWPSARILRARAEGDDRVRLELENLSWAEQGITHRRSCEIGADGVTVLDEIEAPPSVEATVVLHWLVDGDADLVATAASAPATRSVVRGEPGSVLGWISEHYAHKRPASSVRVEAKLRGGRLRLASGFGDRRSPELLAALVRGDAEAVPCST